MLRYSSKMTMTTASLVSLIMAFLLFNWSMTGTPWRNDEQKGTILDENSLSSNITFYSNDPKAEVRLNLTLPLDDEEGAITLSIEHVSNPDTFRWLLLGSGNLAFQIIPDSNYKPVKKSTLPIASILAECKNHTPLSVKNPDRHYSIAYGSINTATTPEEGVQLDGVLGFFPLRAKFPHLKAEGVDTRHYSSTIREIGHPAHNSDKERHIGLVISTPKDPCILTTDEFGRDFPGELGGNKVTYELFIMPRGELDYYVGGTPESNEYRQASYTFEGHRLLTKAYFYDVNSARLHDWLLFISGILGGLSGGFFVSSVTPTFSSEPRENTRT